MRTTILTVRDIERIVEHVGLDDLMDTMVEALRKAFIGHDEQSLLTPVRDGFEYSAPHTGLIEWMPAMRTGESAVIKLVGYHPANPDKYALPTILSSALFFDTTTGRLLSLLDTTFLTALRTGAASAIASQVMAAPESRVLGLVGAGAQAVTQLHALGRLFDLEDVLYFDTSATALDSFVQRASYFDSGAVNFCSAPLEQVCESADIICTSTSVAACAGPVFSDKRLKPWVHVNAVGSDFPGKTELPLSLLERSLVCPDYLPQARREGECQQLTDSAIGPSLPELLQNPDACSVDRDAATVFDSTGWALEDYVAVKLFLRLAVELDCGTEMELTDLSVDPRSPYAFVGAQPPVGKSRSRDGFTPAKPERSSLLAEDE